MAQSSYDSRRRAAPYSPSVKVKAIKKRPPPLTLHSDGCPDTIVWTPGPLSTAQTASSFTSSGFSGLRSAQIVETPLSSASARYYALPAFQVSPSVELHAIPEPFKHLNKWDIDNHVFGGKNSDSNVAMPAAVKMKANEETMLISATCNSPSSSSLLSPFSISLFPPPDPYTYLSNNPWTFPEYLRLLSLVHFYSRPDSPINRDNDHNIYDWNRIATTLNSVYTISSGLRRLPWDCWHRFAVPWIRSESFSSSCKEPSRQLYPNAPGVQHTYRYANIEELIESYDLLARALVTVLNDPSQVSHPLPASFPNVALPTHRERLRHPAYLNPRHLPNVPARTFGHPHDWGMSPWFQMSAVNTTVLRRIVDSTAHGEDHSPKPESPVDSWLPTHLRSVKIPPPSPLRIDSDGT
ncbi:hypothetical protein EW146_g6110 [Bondarzewia mesenterica]|uniref:Uncharacterized protein n=1 Tax=Bondarzewia mesenterica TaxID=1095465 RepID=A0A4S4LPK9_9AGAM|nr:hypothetical protein EW146_g6110 [Bondarzewia mesenterica]